MIYLARSSRRDSISQRSLDEIRLLSKELEQKIRVFRPPIQLSFRFPPCHDSLEPPYEKPDDPNDLLEQRTLALRGDAINSPVADFQKWITASNRKLQRLPARDVELRAGISDLQV